MIGLIFGDTDFPNKILKRNLISNPAGNGDEKTPIVLIRENK